MNYLPGVTTLEIKAEACIGCGLCVQVCPHRVLTLREGRVQIAERDACMECGACARNCPTQAVTVMSGVGCANAILRGMLRGTAPECSCDCGKSGC